MRYIKFILICLACTLSSVKVSAQSDRQLIRNGNRLFHQKKYALAEVEYRKALSKNTQNTQAIYNLGCALMAQRKGDQALAQFANAGKLETNKIRKAKSFHNIGFMCQSGQQYAEAIMAYEEALRNNPTDDLTRYNLALCKRLLKYQNKQDKSKNKQNKNKQDKNKQDKNKQRQKNEQGRDKRQPDNKLSKENAEQLLNAALQDEEATQKRMKQMERRQNNRRLEKNW